MIEVENVIEVRNVTKNFKVYNDRGKTLKERLLLRGDNNYEVRNVLRGISFDIQRGEAIGLIGKNGCGKSTTLKLLTRIIYPNSGTIKIKGRVSSLLELGAGFHPDLSGRENIFMNASVFGLNHKEIEKRMDDIIVFSELEEYIDNPIRTYSSGMFMRLAFSVAINVDADVLLVDEILAVGDISFQKKCLEKLKEIKRSGTTIVIVSHSMDQIESICDRSIWLENGVIKRIGKPSEIDQEYLQEMEDERLEKTQKSIYDQIENGDTYIENSTDDFDKVKNGVKRNFDIGLKMNLLKKDVERTGNGKVHFEKMFVTNTEKKEVIHFERGQDIVVHLFTKTDGKKFRGTIGILIYNDQDVYCYGTTSFIEKQRIIEFEDENYFEITFRDVPLISGKYYFAINIHDEDAKYYDLINYVAPFYIQSQKQDFGVARIENEWVLHGEDDESSIDES